MLADDQEACKVLADDKGGCGMLADDNEGSSADLLDQIDGLLDGAMVAADAARLYRLLDAFMEDPTILDARLAAWFGRVMPRLQRALVEGADVAPLLQLVNHFCKVRGISTIRMRALCIAPV